MEDFENNRNGMDEEEDIVYFEDEEGTEYAFQVLDYFFYNGDEYALLAEETGEEEEDEEAQEVIVCKVVEGTDEDGEETETFDLVEDEELAKKLVEIANTRMAEDNEEE